MNRIPLLFLLAGIAFGQSAGVQHRALFRSDVREATRELKQSIKGVERKLSGIQESLNQTADRQRAATAAAADKIIQEMARKTPLERSFQEDLAQRQVRSVQQMMLWLVGIVILVLVGISGLFYRHVRSQKAVHIDVQPETVSESEAGGRIADPPETVSVPEAGERINDPDVATLERIWKETHVQEVPISLFLKKEGIRVNCVAELRFEANKYPLVRFENGKKVQWKDRMKGAVESILPVMAGV